MPLINPYMLFILLLIFASFTVQANIGVVAAMWELISLPDDWAEIQSAVGC